MHSHAKHVRKFIDINMHYENSLLIFFAKLRRDCHKRSISTRRSILIKDDTLIKEKYKKESKKGHV